MPLSEPIAATIARINRDHAGNSVAAYFNNRYYIAVPLDASTVNSHLLIYNFLNQGWESVDHVGQQGWAIDNLIVAENNGLASLYTVSPGGSIHRVDAREDMNDRLSIYAGVPAAISPISPEVVTRQYTYGTMDRKKFSTYELHVESSSSESSNASIIVEVENPDSTTYVGNLSTLIGGNLPVGEDASVRGRIGNKRGYGAQLSIAPTNGRLKLRAVKVQASTTDPTATSKT